MVGHVHRLKSQSSQVLLVLLFVVSFDLYQIRSLSYHDTFFSKMSSIGNYSSYSIGVLEIILN